MAPSSISASHQAVLAHFSALLKDSRGARQPLLRRAARQLESWALADAALGFTPLTPVDEQGRTLAQALVCNGHLDDARWLRGWAARHGTDAVYPPNHARLVGNGLFDHAVEVLQALVELAPDEALDPSELGAWIEQLTLLPEREHGNGHGTLIQALQARVGADAQAAVRPATRWLAGKAAQALTDESLDQIVRGPSGVARPLREFLATRRLLDHYVGCEGRIASPAALPDLPHGRRRALLEEWVLAPGVSAEDLRRRAWACAVRKPEVFQALLDTFTSAGTPKPVRDRIGLGLALRDPAGRSLAALLATRTRDRDALPTPEALLDAALKAGVCALDDLPSASGEGLVGQVLFAARRGWEGDPFCGLSMLDNPAIPASAWVGPEAQALVEDFVDLIAHGGRMDTGLAPRLALLLRARNHPQAARLEQALAWHAFQNDLRRVAESYLNPRRKPGRTAQLDPKHGDALVAHISAHGMLLEIGRTEWRQWGALGRQAVMARAGNMGGRLAQVIPALERATEMKELALVLPEIPANRAPARPAPRL